MLVLFHVLGMFGSEIISLALVKSLIVLFTVKLARRKYDKECCPTPVGRYGQFAYFLLRSFSNKRLYDIPTAV